MFWSRTPELVSEFKNCEKRTLLLSLGAFQRLEARALFANMLAVHRCLALTRPSTRYAWAVDNAKNAQQVASPIDKRAQLCCFIILFLIRLFGPSATRRLRGHHRRPSDIRQMFSRRSQRFVRHNARPWLFWFPVFVRNDQVIESACRKLNLEHWFLGEMDVFSKS